MVRPDQGHSGKWTDKYLAEKKIEQRLQITLRGAFVGSPTPLQDIPKRSGESRTKRADNTARKTKSKRAR
jgi:hypothetical protein